MMELTISYSQNLINFHSPLSSYNRMTYACKNHPFIRRHFREPEGRAINFYLYHNLQNLQNLQNFFNFLIFLIFFR